MTDFGKHAGPIAPLIAGILVLGGLSGAAAKADAVSGGALYNSCKADPDSPARLYCLGYLMGVWDGLFQAQSKTYQKLVCPPPGQAVTAERMRSIFVKMIDDDPSLTGKPAGVTVATGFSLAFSCAKI